jgi:alcohol oxidase
MGKLPYHEAAQVHRILKLVSFPGDPSLVPAGQYLTASVFTGYPLSRGSIHITGPEIEDKPDFNTGFFSDASDVDILKHLWAYKKQREIFRRMETYRGEVEILHPKFAPTSSAAPVRLDADPALPPSISDIEYTVEDDEAIKEWARDHVGTTWHSMGTCRMGSCKDNAVVDRSLSVYGVEGLKVADMSVPPMNVAANTMNTAIAIAEKAADIFIRELELV